VAPTHLPDLLQEDRPCRSLRHPQLVFTVPIPASATWVLGLSAPWVLGL
jgi:hypothetical protein